MSTDRFAQPGFDELSRLTDGREQRADLVPPVGAPAERHGEVVDGGNVAGECVSHLVQRGGHVAEAVNADFRWAGFG